MKLTNLINLKPLKEGAFGMAAKELAATYSLERLQSIRDEIMGDMEQEAEPEGGRIADMYADQLQGVDDAIAIKRGDSGTPLTYDQAVGRVSKDQFNKSTKFDRMNEATEKSWNAVDVSRKAEKEISNKEWNERTTKKLDMLKSLNKAGKFKKDWGEEKLQGWVDQNYSWEKLSRQFKLNEVYSEMYNEVDSEPDYEWEKGSKAGPGNPAYDAAREKAKQDTRFTIDGKPVDTSSIEMNGMRPEWGPDDGSTDAYIESAYFLDGTELSDDQIERFQDEHPDLTHEKAIEQMYQQEGRMEPEDMDNPDEDLVIIGSGYLDIKSKFRERPPMTNGEYAELGQKVVDQLHNGDKEAALDFIYSKINEGRKKDHDGDGDIDSDDYLMAKDKAIKANQKEGSCGYSQEAPGGKNLKSPGGTQGMDANKRTVKMMRETIKKQIKRLYEQHNKTT